MNYFCVRKHFSSKTSLTPYGINQGNPKSENQQNHLQNKKA